MDGFSINQYNQIVIVFFLGIGGMSASAIYFLMMRGEVAARYRPVVTLSGFFCLIAACNYLWLYATWRESFTVMNGAVARLGGTYDDTYRYADWLLTVPMQLIAFVRVLDLPPHKMRMRSFMLALLGAEMIVLGYPGQISDVAETRWLWFGLALVPFAVIVSHFYMGFAKDMGAEPAESRTLVKMARLVLVMCWPVYAMIFALQTLGYKSPAIFVGVQCAYVLADVGAKILFASLIYMAALAKSAPKAAVSARRLGAGAPPRQRTEA